MTSEVPSRQEAEDTPERPIKPLLILEVGTVNHDGRAEAGLIPSKLPPGSHVITVDLTSRYVGAAGSFYEMAPADPESLRMSYARVANEEREKGVGVPEFSHEAVIGDGRRLPFAGETFARVVFNDVVGDPAVGEAEIRALVNEALRVLKVGGEIWVVDDRAVGANMATLERAFPVSVPTESVCYVRNDLLFSDEFFSEKARENLALYNGIVKQVNAHEPLFTVITKVSEWKPSETVPKRNGGETSQATTPGKGNAFCQWLRHFTKRP